MNRQSPISYIRKQKKLMATLSLWVASMQVFGQAAFIEDPYKAAIEGKHASLTNDKYNFTKDITNDKFSNERSLNEDFSQTSSNEENLIEKLIEIPAKSTLINTINDPETNIQGIIGKSETFPIDDPRDNVFPISLDELPATNQEVYLTYELYGVADAAGASVTINDSYARGGYLFKKSDSWTTQKEKINTEELSKGINFIRFSTLESAGYQYMVKNVQLVVEDVDGLNQKEPFSINQTELKSYDGKLYISGFADQNFGAININGVEITVKEGVFEAVIQDVKGELKISQGENELILPVTNQEGIQPDKIFEVGNTNAFIQKQFFPLAENSMFHDGAALKVPANSIAAEMTFYMSALRYQDLSVVSAEMVNVTGNHSGYRLLPHGEHFVNSPATLEIPYDETKIPAGYKPQDIKTFYFDTNQRKWVALERDTILQDKKIIVSKTTHFTDFINGIIKVPESPETGSFTPTSIKDIKAADPAAGVVSISPPTPNNMGSATTSFPIKLPAGRGGMQPSLSVNYNSEGGNGWMGIGWDISVPSISIDTRWGAPRYDNSSGPDLNCPGYETEIYSMSGEMLVLEAGHEFTNPHRTSEICRMEDREFFLRKENGSYLQIKRHGSSPQSYWWEVTDKMGNKSFYGGYTNEGVVENAVIRTKLEDGNNIAHWALYKTEDTNGNYVEYIYETDTYEGTGAGNNGTEFYLSEIHYTKNDVNNNDAYYKVKFKTDGGGNRDDVQINARLGLIQVTSHLLDEIEIFLVEGGSDVPIRSYQFQYDDPNFLKKQLTQISEYDANDQLFYTNTMEYFGNEITDGTFMSSSLEESLGWNHTDDNVDGGLVLSNVSGQFNDKGSVLGSSKSVGFNGGAAINIGLGFNIFSKMASAGVNFGYGFSNSSGLVSFIDINGDGLPDKVIKDGSTVKYRPNNGNGFDETVTINSLSDFSRTTSNSMNVGVEGNFGIYLGYSYNKSKSVTKVYFSDVNGDGLIDLVRNGQAIFNSNQLTSTPDYNIRLFEDSSGASPNQIEAGTIDNQIITILQPPGEQDQLKQENPLHDVVKVWTAPRSGNFTVKQSIVKLIPHTVPNVEDEDKPFYDGVIVRIEKGNSTNSDNESEIITGTTIELIPDYDENTNEIEFEQEETISAVPLNNLTKGQRVYFRVNSKNEGSYDRVEWNPTIVYSSDKVDANGFQYYSSSPSEGFILSAKSGINVPGGTDIRIEWDEIDISQFEYSDNITFTIERGTIDEEGEFTPVNPPLYYQFYDQEDSGGITIEPSLDISSNFTLPGDQIFYFRALSTSNIDWKKINWKPRIILDDDEENPINAVVEYGIYNKKLNDTFSRIENIDVLDDVIIQHNIPNTISFALPEALLEDFLSKGRRLNMVVKNSSKRKLYTIPLEYSDLDISSIGSIFLIDLSLPSTPANNIIISDHLTSTIFVEFYTDNKYIAANHNFSAQVRQPNGLGYITRGTSTDIYIKDGNDQFGPGYRNWGQFAYRSEGDAGIDGIDETLLVYPEVDEDQIPQEDPFLECYDFPEDSPEFDQCIEDKIDEMGIVGPTDAPFIPFTPHPEKEILKDQIYVDAYEGYDNDTYVEEDAFCSSRLGINNLESLLLLEIDPQFVPGINLISKSEGDSEVAGIGPIGGSWSNSFNYTVNQFMDMNGDNYPDILAENKIQYTSSTGKLSQTINQSFGRTSTAENTTSGSSVSGTFLFANAGNNGSSTLHSISMGGFPDIPVVNPVTSPQPNSSATLSGQSSEGTNEEFLLWIDMNGDGLPDRVNAENDPIQVELNLGYSFGPSHEWENAPSTISGTNTNFSGGASFSILNNSWGGGITASASRAYTIQNFVDINGDGLPDYVYNPGGENIIYRLNNGRGFGSTYTISKALVQSSRSTAEGANITFTFGFTVFLAKFTTSLSLGANQALDRTEHTIADINGDGYADLLYNGQNESDDGNINVRLNKIGKTHLLKQVNTPLGGNWKIDYERDGNTYEMPQSKWVMNSITVNDGFEADNEFAPDESITTIEYENPKHDRREREFMGYETVRANQHDVLDTNEENIYRYSVQEYHNNNYYLKGAVKKESLFGKKEGNFVEWTSTETTYAIMERGVNDPENPVFGANDDFTVNDFGLPRDKSSLFVSPIKTIKKFTEGGGTPLYTYTEIKSFDENGNITEFIDYGNGVDYNDGVLTDSDTSDNVRSVIEYNDLFVGLPTNIKVYENTSTLKRERIASYDNQANLEYVETKLTDSEYAKVSFQYDADYGNLTKVTHEESVDENNEQFFYEYTYDDMVHTYPVRVEDAFGYGSNSTYDYRFGALVYSEDMNYQPMRTRIDDRGRVVEITGPYELFVEGLTSNDPAWTIRFEYEGEETVASRVNGIDFNKYDINAKGSFEPEGSNGFHNAITRHFDPEFRTDPETPITENEIYTITIIDGLGKPIQVKKSTSIKTAVTNSSGDPDETIIDARDTRYWLVNGKVKTDAFGRAEETYYPIVQAYNVNNPFTVAALGYIDDIHNVGEETEPTKAEYDILDRVVETTLPGETASMQTVYSIESSLFKTQVTNEMGQVKQSFTDIRGRTTKVVEDPGGKDIVTQFIYNAIGELLEVWDEDENKTISTYDLAGRRIELRHPDNGITKFTYDNASNLKAKETSNLLEIGESDKIEYSYTFNRLDSISYPLHPHNNVHFFYGQAEDASAADDFTVGRLWYQIDASGVQQFKYGRLGEVTYNLRSVAVPGDKAYWFQTKWEYDTWNRVKKITYPDEEEVTYFYNRGGELHAITSKKEAQQNEDIISQLGYDKFGQRTYLRYGNGTETEYTYEDERRRLELMTVSNSNRTFINNAYEYDILSNVTGIINTPDALSAGEIGGSVTYEYGYDNLNRLTTATGIFTGRNATDDGLERQQYTLAMEYDNLHNITSKQQLHQSAPGDTGGTWTDIPATTYSLDYQDDTNDGYGTADFNIAGYQYNQPHAPRKIIDKPYVVSPDSDKKTKIYDYDANGNLTDITQTTGESEAVEKLRTNLWDEENRLRAVDITPDAEGVRPIAIYTYDAGGERILKHSNTSVSIYLNGKKVADEIQTDATLYPSGMLVARVIPGEDEESPATLGYTKHYYSGTQRVSSKIGTTENLGDFLQDWFTQGTGGPVDVVGSSNDVILNAQEGVVQVYTELDIEPAPTFESSPVFIPVQSFTHGDAETEQYWFHPDHLGSSNYITNLAGEVSQHMEYFAFGETFVEEHRSSNNSPYKFNSKELDEETGWYYYGARYYDAKTSVWLSVDPLMEQTMQPYQYTYQNPIRYIDPTGMSGEDPPAESGNHINHDDKTITIMRNIYFENESDLKSNQAAIDQWNNYSGTATYTTKDKVEYTLNIVLNATVVKTGQTLEDALFSDDGGITIRELNDKNFLSTAVQWDKENKAAGGTGLSHDSDGGKNNGGITNGNKVIQRLIVANDNSRAHEIGHALGLEHSTGVMAPAMDQGMTSVQQHNYNRVFKNILKAASKHSSAQKLNSAGNYGNWYVTGNYIGANGFLGNYRNNKIKPK